MKLREVHVTYNFIIKLTHNICIIQARKRKINRPPIFVGINTLHMVWVGDKLLMGDIVYEKFTLFQI